MSPKCCLLLVVAAALCLTVRVTRCLNTHSVGRDGEPAVFGPGFSWHLGLHLK